MQGFGKFGFYEIFKDVYRSAAGENEPKYRTIGFAVSSACAEVIADCLLCPMEAVSTAKNSKSLYYITNNINRRFLKYS